MAAPTLRVSPTTLSTGTIVRIVDLGAGQTPRYVMEVPNGIDAMGVTSWAGRSQFAVNDVIAMLVAVGFLT